MRGIAWVCLGAALASCSTQSADVVEVRLRTELTPQVDFNWVQTELRQSSRLGRIRVFEELADVDFSAPEGVVVAEYEQVRPDQPIEIEMRLRHDSDTIATRVLNAEPGMIPEVVDVERCRRRCGHDDDDRFDEDGRFDEGR